MFCPIDIGRRRVQDEQLQPEQRERLLRHAGRVADTRSRDCSARPRRRASGQVPPEIQRRHRRDGQLVYKPRRRNSAPSVDQGQSQALYDRERLTAGDFRSLPTIVLLTSMYLSTATFSQAYRALRWLVVTPAA